MTDWLIRRIISAFLLRVYGSDMIQKMVHLNRRRDLGNVHPFSLRGPDLATTHRNRTTLWSGNTSCALIEAVHWTLIKQESHNQLIPSHPGMLIVYGYLPLHRAHHPVR